MNRKLYTIWLASVLWGCKDKTPEAPEKPQPDSNGPVAPKIITSAHPAPNPSSPPKPQPSPPKPNPAPPKPNPASVKPHKSATNVQVKPRESNLGRSVFPFDSRVQLCDAYSFLGVDSAASSGQIKKAYAKLSLIYHPDKNAMATSRTKARHAAMFVKLSNSYAITQDPDLSARCKRLMGSRPLSSIINLPEAQRPNLLDLGASLLEKLKAVPNFALYYWQPGDFFFGNLKDIPGSLWIESAPVLAGGPHFGGAAIASALLRIGNALAEIARQFNYDAKSHNVLFRAFYDRSLTLDARITNLRTAAPGVKITPQTPENKGLAMRFAMVQEMVRSYDLVLPQKLFDQCDLEANVAFAGTDFKVGNAIKPIWGDFAAAWTVQGRPNVALVLGSPTVPWDRAFLEYLDGHKGLVPRIVPDFDSKHNDMCFFGWMALEFPGDVQNIVTLAQYALIAQKSLLAITIRVLEILKELNSVGVYHTEISLNNVVCDKTAKDVVKSVQVLTFTLAKPVYDDRGYCQSSKDRNSVLESFSKSFGPALKQEALFASLLARTRSHIAKDACNQPDYNNWISALKKL